MNMDNYDLARYCANILSPLFQSMGWTWGEKKIPTYNEVAESIDRLLDECRIGGQLSTGRIMVEKYQDEEGRVTKKVYLELGETEE